MSKKSDRLREINSPEFVPRWLKILTNLQYRLIIEGVAVGLLAGLLVSAFRVALSKADEIRIDTHHDNKTMQHVVMKHGFRRCGIIYLANGDPRIAYQYSKEK